jgi:hypothetical protein
MFRFGRVDDGTMEFKAALGVRTARCGCCLTKLSTRTVTAGVMSALHFPNLADNRCTSSSLTLVLGAVILTPVTN